MKDKEIITGFVAKLKEDLNAFKEANDNDSVECICNILAYFEDKDADEIMYTPEGVAYCLKEAIDHEINKQTIYVEFDLDDQLNTSINKVMTYQDIESIFKAIIP